MSSIGPNMPLFLSSFISLSAAFDQGVCLQLFQMTCSIFELLLKLTLDYLLGIVANTSWWDFIPSKQQWQGLMCFTSGCHWESSSPSKVCGIYLCTSIAPSRYCTGKYHVWEYRMCQEMITNISVIYSESSQQWRVEHRPNQSLHCGLHSVLCFLRGNVTSFS